jgi:hypothetical protein
MFGRSVIGAEVKRGSLQKGWRDNLQQHVSLDQWMALTAPELVNAH